MSFCAFLGVYVPLTMEGKMVVDGIWASCYAIVDHDLAQIAMKPIQWYPDIIDMVFGDENGVSVFVSVFQDFGRWVLPFGSKSLLWKYKAWHTFSIMKT